MTHLSLVQISGVSYYELYERLFDEADVQHNGVIPAFQAAKFLKRSGLSDSLLSKIWEQADIEKKGELHKQGFFMALKLIALAQQGTDPAIANLISDIPPPRLSHKSGDIPETAPPHLSSPPITPAISTDIWEVPSDERARYESFFHSLSTDGSKLPGEVVRPLLLQSGLPTDVLVTIWDLSDVDKDGFLDLEEFVLSMHLTQRRRNGKALPDKVPPSVVTKMKGPSQPPPVPTPGGSTMGFENHFSGFVDFGTSGTVSNDLGGITCESEGLLKEVEDIKKQKLDVDLQVLQLESDLKLKQAEMKVMQRELDHMSNTYHHLEVQKEEAQKRLDELADNSTKLRMSHDEYKEKIQREEETIVNLKGQMNSQEMSARSHEEEIALLRSELNDLMVKESALQEELTNSNRQVAALQKENQQSEDELKKAEAKTKAMMTNKTQLEEVLTTLNALIRGETAERPLPSDDTILSLLDDSQLTPPTSMPAASPLPRVTASPQPQAWAADVSSSSSPSSSKPGGIGGGQQIRPASASPQAVPFAVHFPTPSQPGASGGGAAWPPVGSNFSGKRQSATMGAQGKANFVSGSSTMPPPSTGETVTKTKSKKSKSPFSRTKKSSSSSSTSSARDHHEKRSAAYQQQPQEAVIHQSQQPQLEQSGFGDFADFSRFDGHSRAKACPSEDEQLAWAKMESQRMQRDEEKKRRQEEADLQLAIQLSKMNS